MYAYSKPKSDKDEKYLGEQIKYWRKNNALHNWMMQLWYKRIGHTKETFDYNHFNCQRLELTKEDILQLLHDIVDDKMIPTAGFFWGNMEYDSWQKETDLQFCVTALADIADGNVITYCADW